MKIPSTSAGLYFHMSPEKKNVLLASALGNTTTALQVGALTEKQSGLPITAATTSLNPIWGGSTFYGKYAAGGSTTMVCAPLAGQQPGLTFNGTSQYLEFDALATNLATGTDPPFTVVVQVQSTTTSSNQTIFSFGSSSSGTPLVVCYASNTSLVLKETNSNNTFTNTYSSFDQHSHVVTAVRASGALTLRVDGVQVATTALTAVSTTFNRFCIGAQNSNGTINNYFTGVIGKFLAFGSNTGGIADIVDLEKDLMLEAGITEF
jgi:hypothetical protein